MRLASLLVTALLLGWSVLSAASAVLAIWKNKFQLARLAAIMQVTLILLGWGLAQFPNVVMPDITIFNSAAPRITLELLITALGFGAVVLIPSLAYLFFIFKGKTRTTTEPSLRR